MSALPVVAVAAIVFDAAGERVLLVERGRPPGVGLWSAPGGKLLRGEALAAGVAREVHEETGLAIEVGPLVAVIERVDATYHYVILDYVARVAGAPADPIPGDDARAARWVPLDGLDALPLTDGLADVIARARATHRAWLG